MTHFKNIIVILLWWLLSLPVLFLGFIMVPLALRSKKPISSGLDNSIAQYPNWRLPAWAWPWDNRMDGAGGDKYWRTKHHPGDWDRFWVMVTWLSWRNYCFNWRVRFGGVDGFANRILINGEDQSDIPLKDRPRVDNYMSRQGGQFNEIWLDDDIYRAQYKYMKAYPFKIAGHQLGLFVDIGADISGCKSDAISHLTHTVRINPFKGFE